MDVIEVDAVPDDRDQGAYQKIKGHGPNRLLLYTFLAALAFGAFAGSLGVTHITDLPATPLAAPRGQPSDLANVRLSELALVVDAFLGVAALLFLLAVVFTYQPVQYFVNLTDAQFAQEPTRKGRRYLKRYRAAGHLIPAGVLLVVLSVLLLGFYVSALVGIVMIVLIVILAARALWLAR